jgi:hypothetical protein
MPASTAGGTVHLFSVLSAVAEAFCSREAQSPGRVSPGVIREHWPSDISSNGAFGLPLTPDGEQAVQFDDRFGMVVDAKIADAINAFSGARRCARLLDDKRSRLLPSAVTPCCLCRFKRRHHPLRELRRRRLNERAPHSRKDVGARKRVSLHREPMLN